ncbi:MAG: DUF1571 domain-containing protein [Nitrospinota bacterium]|nr:MAG: DUF1571 domain-containing protein [Nitrospinota bacterium]
MQREEESSAKGGEGDMQRWWLLLLVMITIWTGSGLPVTSNQYLADPLSLLFQMEKRYQTVEDYTAILKSQERIEGRLKPESTIAIKFKKPFMVYMKWLDGPHKGREVLYVEGKNDNKLLVQTHKWYQFFPLSLDPYGSMAMEGNRHPITDIGIGRLIQLLTTNFRQAQANGEVQIVEASPDTIFQRPAYKIEARFPAGKYYAPRVILHIDQEYLLPIQVTVFDEADQMVEKYGYTNLRLNVGLTEHDFDKENKDYGF